MKSIVTNSVCPCRVRDSVPLSYGQCCQPWHTALAHGGHADTAEQLMRSRYSAYALAVHNNPHGHAMLNYLHATWHPSTAPGDLDLSPIQWTGLEVLRAEQSDTAAVVEFVAYYKTNGKAQQMQETSRFTRHDRAPAQWLYIDGQASDA